MPRNSAGEYSLPSSVNPVVTGSTITSNWATTTLNDIATALTASLSRDGQGSMTAPLLLANGLVTAPSLSFSTNTVSGIYFAATQGQDADMRVTIAEQDVMRWVENSQAVPATYKAEIYIGGTWQPIATGTSSLNAGTFTNQTLRWDTANSAWQTNNILTITDGLSPNLKKLVGINLGEDTSVIPTVLNIPRRELEVKGHSLTEFLEVGDTFDPLITTPFWQSRAMITSVTDSPFSFGKVNCLLGSINPVIAFTNNINALETGANPRPSTIGLITSTDNANRYPSSLGNEKGSIKYEAEGITNTDSGRHTFWTTRYVLGTVVSSKRVEFNGGGIVSVNVFNKMGSGAVTNRVDSGKLIVAAEARANNAENIPPVNRLNHSIVVTDTGNGGNLTGTGGSIAFSAATSNASFPSTFAAIKGYLTSNNAPNGSFPERGPTGHLDTYVKGFSGQDEADFSWVTRHENSSFVAAQNIIILNDAGTIDSNQPVSATAASPNGRAIVSDRNGWAYTGIQSFFSTLAGSFSFTYNSSGDFKIHYNALTIATIGSTSDYRLKENVTPLANSLDQIKLMRPVTYNHKKDESLIIKQGFIAHEMQEIIPSIVSGEKDAATEEGEIIPQSIYYAGLTPILVKAVQELTARIEALEA
tara:strand:- start:1872 stop:3803 length:1932 start_codon:yes stop_codon:yes gene_type:complete